MASPTPTTPAAQLQSATRGFDHLFANDILLAQRAFTVSDSPFHLAGAGVCAFLEAALGMESVRMAEAAEALTVAEAATRKAAKEAAKGAAARGLKGGGGRFPAGMEYEIMNADCVVLLGMTSALSESYMGYLQCMYSLNSAHSKFTKLYQTVFPNGLSSVESRSEFPTATPSASTSASLNNSLAPSLAPTPSTSLSPTPKSSISNLRSSASSASLAPSSISAASNTSTSATPPKSPAKSFFGRWSKASSSTLTVPLAVPSVGLGQGGGGGGGGGAGGNGGNGGNGEGGEVERREGREGREGREDGPVEEMIVAGTAFGYGLFNLVFSLLPKKVQSVVGFFGFKHDRKLALRALAVAAAGRDNHSVFAGLVLMTYHGVVLLLSGYQADEEHILRQYKGIVDKVQERYPTGALWVLNRAKILRMSHDAEGAIRVLQAGLEEEAVPRDAKEAKEANVEAEGEAGKGEAKEEKEVEKGEAKVEKERFAQADTLLIFELAWTLLGQRRYAEAADAFIRMTELNSWSHATYYFIAAGCYISIGNTDKAQVMFDAIAGFIDKKFGGKELPTEVLIKKKLEFYKEKQKRCGGDVLKYAECIKISPAEELGVFWNTHSRISKSVAEAHIADWAALSPPVTIPSPYITTTTSTDSTPSSPDLDTPDELALRSLLLGICHRTTADYAASRLFLADAHKLQGSLKVSTWIGGVAMFELAVLDLKEVEAKEKAAAKGINGEKGRAEASLKKEWVQALGSASEKLEKANALAPNSIDLSGRLDSRIAMLRDEIATKKEMLGLA